MSPLELRDLIDTGAINRLSQAQAVALRQQVLGNHRADYTNPRALNHRVYSDAVVALSKVAFGEGADLPIGESGVLRDGSEP